MENELIPTILIVDDTEQNLEVVGSILSEHGYNIIMATNGIEAIESLKEELPDLILLDVMMPEMDGFEVCTKLKEDKRTEEVPIIFLTAKVETEDIVKGFILGGVDYITKPFKKEELLARVKTHIKLRQNEKSLKESNATKDKLFSIIAHDLRGPIGTYMTLMHTLLNDSFTLSDDAKTEYLVQMKESIQNIYSLLENLLYWARSQRNAIQFNPGLNNLNAIIEENIDLLSSSVRRKSITLQNEIEENIIINFDENMVTTIIRNLLSNAIKFTPEKGEIRINAMNKNDFIEISISDTGIGIPEENIEKLFQSDKIYSTWGTKGEKGTGLGLTVCKEFVERSGGKIWVEGEAGKGSKFIFTLPKK